MKKTRAKASKDKVRKINQEDLSFFANNVVKSMLDQQAYTAMQPTVLVLQTQAATYAQSLTNIKTKSVVATREKNTAKELLLITLFSLIDEINAAVKAFTQKEFDIDPNADANYIKNAGFKLQDGRVKKKKETPTTPSIKSILPTGNDGALAITLNLDTENTIKITAVAISYDNGVTYELNHKYLVNSSGTIDDLRPASIAWLRFASVGANGIASDWTELKKVAIL